MTSDPGMKLRSALRILLPAAIIAAMPAGAAYAQMSPIMPKLSLGSGEQKKLTPEEQARRQQLDEDYKAATNKIPDQKTSNDPWADVRTAPGTKSKPQ